MARPTFLGDPTIIAGRESVDEGGGAVGLANGGVGFVFASYTLLGHDTSLEGVTLALMDGATGQVGREVTLRGFQATGLNGQPEATVLEDGRILVSWLGSFDPVTGRDCYFRIFDASGRPAGEVTQIDPRDAGQGNAGAPDITALDNGGFVAAWEQYVNGSWESFARAYGADGLPVGDVIRLNAATEGNQGVPEITALAGGGFMAVWQEDFNPSLPPGDKVLMGRIFAANGSAVSGDIVVSATNGPGNDFAQAHAVTELAGGLVAATWHHSQEPEEPGMEWIDTVKARLFGADGVAIGPEFVVSQADTDAFRSTNPVIAALQDGRFMVAWTEYEIAGGASRVMARIVNADGSFSSRAFDLAPGSDLSPSNPTLAVMADGRVMVTYGVTGAGSWGQDLISQLLDPREAAIDVTGTGDGDGLVGTGFADRIAGGNGRDHILGAGGADRLLGQTGNDTLDGGGGRDRITGGGGADELTGGLGRDVFVFAAGDGSDRVTDFAVGQDRLDLRAFGFADVAEALSHFTQGRDATLFEFGGTVILLDGLGLSALDGGSLLV